MLWELSGTDERAVPTLGQAVKMIQFDSKFGNKINKVRTDLCFTNPKLGWNECPCPKQPGWREGSNDGRDRDNWVSSH